MAFFLHRICNNPSLHGLNRGVVAASSEHGPALLQSPGTHAVLEGVLANKVETAVA